MAHRTYCWHLPHFDIWGHCSHPWGCYETNSFQKCPNKSVCRKHLCLPEVGKFTNHWLLWNSWGILILKLSFGMTSRDRSWTCWNPAWTVYVMFRTVSKKNKYTVLVVCYIILYLSFRNTHSQPLVTTLKHHLFNKSRWIPHLHSCKPHFDGKTWENHPRNAVALYG